VVMVVKTLVVVVQALLISNIFLAAEGLEL
jgi:hypothetical protein